MKKYLFSLVALMSAFVSFGEFGPIRPVPVQRIVLEQAKAYADAQDGAVLTNVHDSLAYKFEKIAPYLYKTQVNEFDWDRIAETYKRIDPSLQVGACSSVRSGNFVGRNLDWSYDNTADIIVHTVKGQNVKHSSIAVATGVPGVEEGDLSAGKYAEKLWIAAYSVCDGVNDAGVEINHNVVPGPTNKADAVTYTNRGKKRLCSSNVIRWVLNNADSASNAVEIIKNDIDIFIPNVLHGYESHWMIADRSKTYVVELKKGQVISIDISDRPCMTNFRIEGTSLTPDGKIDINTVERYAQGTERYDLFLSKASEGATAAGMINLMNSYPYTMCYDVNRKPDPFWYSDYVGNGNFGDLTIHSPTNAFDGIIAFYRQQYEHRTRSNPDCWQTVHATVYDLQNLIMYITPQESGETFMFKLNPYKYE